jgi:hypothetical protein
LAVSHKGELRLNTERSENRNSAAAIYAAVVAAVLITAVMTIGFAGISMHEAGSNADAEKTQNNLDVSVALSTAVVDKSWITSGWYMPGWNTAKISSTPLGEEVVDRNTLHTVHAANALIILLLILLTCIGTQFICGACHSPHITVYRQDGQPNYPRTIDYTCDDCGAVVKVTQLEPNKKNIAI